MFWLDLQFNHRATQLQSILNLKSHIIFWPRNIRSKQYEENINYQGLFWVIWDDKINCKASTLHCLRCFVTCNKYVVEHPVYSLHMMLCCSQSASYSGQSCWPIDNMGWGSRDTQYTTQYTHCTVHVTWYICRKEVKILSSVLHCFSEWWVTA